MEHQFLLPGDSATARSPTHLATLLGSCVSVCLSNAFQRVAGMNHHMLPGAIAGGDVGTRNVEVARRLLGELCIDIQHEEVGGNRGRRIDFDTRTDVIRCRLVGFEAPS